MGVIQRMGMVATDEEDRPKNPITIHKATAWHGPPPPLEEQQTEEREQHLAITAAS